jgi:hypothetical protein
VHVDVGKPGGVKLGRIQLRSVYFRKMEYYREQMMRMLQGLLPDVPPESVADIARSEHMAHNTSGFTLFNPTPCAVVEFVLKYSGVPACSELLICWVNAGLT